MDEIVVRSEMRVTFIAESISGNSLGRTYCLWLLARHLGWEAQVLSTRGEHLWRPLQDTDFASSCANVAPRDLVARVRSHQSEVIIGVKPHPESLGLALHAGDELSLPVVADIDDPDLEEKLSWERPFKRTARSILRPAQVRAYSELRRAVTKLPLMVSNPVLASRYGGVVVPHVREAGSAAPTPPAASRQIRVAFVGTVRPHKGIEVLRKAVTSLRGENFELTVTAEPPANAKPWEHWVGEGSIEEGRRIVEDSDIIAVPSLRNLDTRAQFPAKLLDAMFASRPIVTSDVGPIPWVVGEGARLATPGSWRSLRDALISLESPPARQDLGARARQRAVRAFSVDAAVGPFADCVERAVRREAAGSFPQELEGK